MMAGWAAEAQGVVGCSVSGPVLWLLLFVFPKGPWRVVSIRLGAALGSRGTMGA